MTTSFPSRIARFLRQQGAKLGQQWSAPAPVRPLVLIQSDDWGLAGVPSLQALERSGIGGPFSPWDLYGLETEADLLSLAAVLGEHTDKEKNSAVMSAVFITANPDVVRMEAEGYQAFRTVPLWQGLPSSWSESSLVDVYRHLVDSKHFFPALHGFTHCNQSVLLAMAREDSARGESLRSLHRVGIPYLSSRHRECNFALLDRRGTEEVFLPEHEQRIWLQQGIEHFEKLFGFRPGSTCAPGYRFNDVTCALWKAEAIPVIHSASPVPDLIAGLWNQSRNVFFEPVLQADALAVALSAADAAVRRGEPVVICTHSINYVTRHGDKAAQGLSALRHLLTALLARYPDLRFVHELQLYESLQTLDSAWWRAPTGAERRARLAKLAGAST